MWYWIYLFCIIAGIYRGLFCKPNRVVKKDSGDFFDMMFLKIDN